MVKLNKKQLLSLAEALGAHDITNATPGAYGFPEHREKIAFSDGTNGVNGVIVRDDHGIFYYTRSRCSNNYVLL